jgi:hypothetical protein
MNWIDLIWAVLACVACVLVPGALLGALVGLRGMWLWAAAPPFSMTVIGFASLIGPVLGLGWGIWPVLLTTTGLGALLALARFLLRRWWTPQRPEPGASWPWVTALAIASSILAVRSYQIVGDPANISQTFDNIFHLNAVRFVLDTSNASPLHIGSMTSENLWFYPASWHALAALVVDLTGAGVPVAVNAVWMVFSALVWPLSILVLVRTLFGSRPAVMLTAGVVAAGLPAFPVLMIDYGVLYPYHAGLALVPVAVAAAIRLLGVGALDRSSPPVLWAVVLLGCLPGIALLHPGAFVAVLALSLPVAVVAAARALRRPRDRKRASWVVIGFAVYAIVGLLAVRVLRPPAEASQWPPVGTAAQAFGEVLTIGLYGAEAAVAAAVLLVIGIVVGIGRHRREDLVALGLLLLAAGLYIVAAGVDHPAIRAEITGPWYNNPPRLAAILPTVTIPLVAFGGGWVWGKVEGLAARMSRSEPRRRWPATVTGVVLLVALGASLQAGPMVVAVRNANFIYSLSDVSPLVSADEMALIRRLPDTVPEDVAIAGSPWTGTSMAYAIADRRVLMPHTLMDTTAGTDLVNAELDEASGGGDADLCAAIARENVGFVLDFGTKEVHGGVHEFSGLDDLARSDAVRLVDREGRAKLYEIVACAP